MVITMFAFSELELYETYQIIEVSRRLGVNYLPE
jgi:hypothetical protein